MPPKIKTDRTAILDGVMAIIEEQGYGAVSARSVADRLGISTQPIYREFKNMDGIRKAAVERGFEMFSRYISGDALFQAVRYVTFASEHGNLFDFLFRGKHREYSGLDDLAHSLIDGTDIIDRLTEITELPRERVYRLHLLLWMALHGLAAFGADNKLALGEGEVETFTKELTRALTAYYKAEETK